MFDDADDVLEQAMEAEDAGRFALAHRLYKKHLSLAPESAYGWFRYACLLKEQKQWKRALDAAKRGIELCGDDSHLLALGQRLVGQCFMDQEQWGCAEGALRESLKAEPNPITWVFLGYTLSELDRCEEEIAAYEAAIALDPDDDEAHHNLGYCFERRRDYDRAIEHYRAAIRLDPRYARAYAQLGFVLAYCKKSAGTQLEARDLLAKAVEFDPDYLWARLYYASLLEDLGEDDAAMKQYGATLRLDPQCAMAHSHLGMLLASNANDCERAKYHLTKAVELAPDSKIGWYYLGSYLFFGLDRRAEAKRCLVKAIALGHKRAARILARINECIPKRQRTRRCSQCGEPMKNKGSKWWCPGCGSDLRAVKNPKKQARRLRLSDRV